MTSSDKSWQHALDPALVGRLLRPLTRPGVIAPAHGRALLARLRAMPAGLPLLGRMAAYLEAGEAFPGAQGPIVHPLPVAAPAPAPVGGPPHPQTLVTQVVLSRPAPPATPVPRQQQHSLLVVQPRSATHIATKATVARPDATAQGRPPAPLSAPSPGRAAAHVASPPPGLPVAATVRAPETPAHAPLPGAAPGGDAPEAPSRRAEQGRRDAGEATIPPAAEPARFVLPAGRRRSPAPPAPAPAAPVTPLVRESALGQPSPAHTAALAAAPPAPAPAQPTPPAPAPTQPTPAAPASTQPPPAALSAEGTYGARPTLAERPPPAPRQRSVPVVRAAEPWAAPVAPAGPPTPAVAAPRYSPPPIVLAAAGAPAQPREPAARHAVELAAPGYTAPERRAAPAAPAAPPAPAEPPARRAAPLEPLADAEVARLSERVYDSLVRRLAAERGRRGL